MHAAARPAQFPASDASQPASTGATARPRRTPSKPQTPRSASNGVERPRKASSDHKKVKPSFITSLSFPEAVNPQLAVPLAIQVDDSEQGRSQRRSKVEAISKIDRAGTPIALTAGPGGTSFIPATLPSAAGAGPSSSSGPSVSRNPLHKPPVVNPPFDLASVRTSAPRHPPSRSGSRLFGLEECPTYYPTEAEFGDCMAYIDSIAPEAKAYGICKIVPPEGWRMPFVLDTDKFRFKTRLQRLNSLEAASRAKVNFLEQLGLYYEQLDAKLVIPILDRRQIDLYQLRKAVIKIGGVDEVNRMKGWPIIAKSMGYDERYAISIKSIYNRIIIPFDTFASGGKSASGSPLTPMPSTTASKPPGFANISPASPTTHSRMGGLARPPPAFNDRPTKASPSPPVAPLALPPSGPLRDLTPGDLPSRPDSAASSMTTARIKVPGFTSRDGSESELSDEDPPPVKIRIKPPKMAYQKGEVCEVCQRGDDAPKILLCDSCDKGFHTYCLNPPLTFVPANEEWYCGPCLFAQGDDYGFDEGEDHSIASFQARDNAFAQHWWSKHPTVSSPDSTSRQLGACTVSEDDVEREFWRLTDDPNDTVEIEYGADVHSTTHGSGSPSLETHPLNQYSRDGWNLNNMPILSESLLRYIRSDISGMTVPWIYVGMMLSAFCWHNEDHYTYSVNYMHWGETKTWYGIPGSDAEKFEDAMKSEAPELFEQQPSLLYQLVTMMNPGRVKEAGVRVLACDQRPNEFVITFPKAYHCGFNHGINFNEAVNFALPDWLADGKEAVLRYKMHSKAPVFSHNELLINITLYSETIRTAIWLHKALKEMVDEETARRDRLRADIPMLVEQLVEEDCPEEQYQCCICKGFCYLSQVTCACTKSVACVDHADSLCACSKTRRTLRKRFSEAQLEEILAVVQNRAAQPEQWRARLDGLLEVARPPLKSMRALLTDGEKIAHSMPEVYDLRAAVARANAVVEHINALATRKSTGRKKRRHTGPEDELDRSPDALKALLKEAERLGFESPEIPQLRHMLLQIESFKTEAGMIMSTPDDELDLEKCKTALILGNSLNIDLPEINSIQTVVNRLHWFQKVEEEVDDRTLQYAEVLALLEEAEGCKIPVTHPALVELKKREARGREWKAAVDRLYASPTIDIDSISALIEGQELVPTSLDKMRELESIRKQAQTWQATAQSQFEGNGSSNAAQRLCKAVRTANGALRKIRIPEVEKLQLELDFHARCIENIADTLRVPAKNVSATLANILTAFEQHLQIEDNHPNPDFACFCRGQPHPVMVKCQLCNGQYHPKCVKVAANNVDKPFKCPMCVNSSIDDRPSLHALSMHSMIGRYRFLIVPPEMITLNKIVDIAIDFAQLLVPVVDPFNTAVQCRNFELLAHWHRKLFSLPVTFDAEQTSSKNRIVFEEWLWKRMVESQERPRAKMRQRKPKFVLRQCKPGLFGCICATPPNDAIVTVECSKCLQSYHASCVRAPPECLGSEREPWRCPCCTVREAKRHQQGDVIVRVQNHDRIGTDVYIDYRTTIATFATSILEYTLPKADAIVLECIDFIQPIIPEGFVPPTVEQSKADDMDDRERKTKKRRISAAAPAAQSKLGATPVSNGLANGLVNGHASTSVAAATNGTAFNPAQPAVSAPTPAPAPVHSSPALNPHHRLSSGPAAIAISSPQVPQPSSGAGTLSESRTPFPSVLDPGPAKSHSITVNRPPVPLPEWLVNATRGPASSPGPEWSGLAPSQGSRSRTTSDQVHGATRSDPIDVTTSSSDAGRA